MESLLTTVYPGAVVAWDPWLMVELPGEQPRIVAVPVSVRGSGVSGEVEGVATIELDKNNEQYIFEAESFRLTARKPFPTEVFVFRADSSGRILRYKRLPLDPAEALTEMKDMSIEDWSQKEWPTVRIQYQTHRVRKNSFTTVEWHGTLDANSGEFITRLPFGISKKTRAGSEQMIAFALGRSSPSTVRMKNIYGGETHEYNCFDPCVMDADTLLSQWNLNDARDAASDVKGGSGDATPAIIHLKNGGTIHADSVNEAGDKVEYTAGEAEYRIPKSLVQEIVRTAEGAPGTDKANQKGPPSSQAQDVDIPCTADTVMAKLPVPCKSVFFVQTIMLLGETQKFSLIDNGHHDVTAQAQWSLLDFGSGVDFSVVNGVPHVFSKNYGMVQLYAVFEGKSAMTRIYIVKPDELASNTMGRKGSPMSNNDAPLQIIIADPHVGRIP